MPWLTNGGKVLIMKNKEKGNDVINSILITCLLSMWKVFTRIPSGKLFDNLENER